jgi:hypothetical protein
MPFAIRNLQTVSLKLACCLLGFVLFVLNFMNALDVATHGREVATGVARGTLAQASALKSRIADSRKARAQVPPFTFTSTAMVSAAETAVRAAEAARDAECRKVGDKCRQRQDEVTAASERLAAATAQRELTERAERIDSELTGAEASLAALGPLPKHGDDTAAKIARIVAVFVSVDANTEETFAEWRPILFAAGIELLAFIGPLGMMAAIAGGGAGEAQGPDAVTPKANAQKSKPVVILQHPSTPEQAKQSPRRLGTFAKGGTPDAVIPAALRPTPASAASPKNTGAGVSDVREWLNSRTAARPDNLVRVNECYDAYLAWSQERGLQPVTLTKFGKTMKGDLGVAYIERSKRSYYSGIVLTGAPLLKVVNGGM